MYARTYVCSYCLLRTYVLFRVLSVYITRRLWWKLAHREATYKGRFAPPTSCYIRRGRNWVCVRTGSVRDGGRFARTRRCSLRSHVKNFERPFSPREWLRSARNLAKTRFRRFPTFHFSTLKKIFLWKFFKNFSRTPPLENREILVLEELRILSVTGRSASKNELWWTSFQLSTTFGRGVKSSICVFLSHLGQNRLTVFLWEWQYDETMIWW